MIQVAFGPIEAALTQAIGSAGRFGYFVGSTSVDHGGLKSALQSQANQKMNWNLTPIISGHSIGVLVHPTLEQGGKNYLQVKPE